LRVLNNAFDHPLKGKTIDCFRMSGKYARAAFNEINIAYSQKQIKAPSSPVSCAAMLAQKMGLSDMHVAMAAAQNSSKHYRLYE